MSESLCERCGRPSGGLRCAAAVCPPLVAMRRAPRCACGKEATRELADTAEGEAERLRAEIVRCAMAYTFGDYPGTGDLADKREALEAMEAACMELEAVERRRPR